jgi:broad specificity phosphatase PhoE
MVDFHSIKGTADFIFTRHGESEGNRDGIMQGRLPSRLTDTGRTQARETGSALISRPPDVILSSPLTRARETAEIIAETAGVTGVVVCEELTEIDTGIFTSMSFTQVKERYPAEWAAFRSGGWETVPGAEKAARLSARAHAVWERLIGLAGQGKKSVLGVSHSGFIQWILRSTMGLNAWMPLVETSRHCGITLLHVDNNELSGGGFSYFANWAMINLPASLAFPPIDASKGGG